MIEDFTNTIINQDVLTGLKMLPDCSVDCVITSPPYWQLRDYGYPEQWGLEPTFEEYLNHLWQFMDEVHRVIKDTGTVWVNLGDTYGTVSGAMREGKPGRANKKIKDPSTVQFTQPKSISKCLLLIPHRFAIGCIDRGWILRNDVIWAKRNGMPESVRDRFSKKHEFVFFMVKNQKYYFDLDGVRTPYTEPMNRWGGDKLKATNKSSWDLGTKQTSYRNRAMRPNKLGKNPGDVSDFWDIPTKPSKAKHYATFNSDLINKPIIAGCPLGGIVLDPFCGVGTTLMTAKKLGRTFIGIEAKTEYCDIANQNVSELHLAI